MKSLLAVISFLFFLQATLGQSVLSSVDYYYPFELGVARARYAVMLEYAAGQDSISFAFTINTNLVPGVSGAVIPGGVSPYENVDPALTEVVVRAWIAGTNVEVAQLLTEVCQATDYTFVLRADANGNYFLQKFVDDNSDLPSGYARVRVFHSSSRALFSLNLYDFANALSSNLLIGNIQPGDMSGYATIASGSHTFYVGAATGGVSPTQLAPQNLDNRATYTIWVVGNINALPNTLNSWRTVFSPDFTISPTTGAVIPQPKNGKTGYARIRFIAADSTVPNAQFQLGALPVTALNYGNASSYMTVQQGRNSYSVFQTGLRFIAIGTLYLTQNHDYTLVLRTRPDGVPEVRLYEDYNYTPKHGFANVRFMNLFTGIAPPVDLAVERFEIASNLKFGTHSRYVPIEVRNPPMPINLRIMEHLALRRVLAVIPNFESNIYMATTYTCVLGGNGVKPMLMMFVDDGTGAPGAAETVSMNFDMAINTAIAAGKFPAVSAAIAQFSPNASSSLLWSKSYGYAQIEHTNRNSKNTMFLAGAVGEGLISTLVYWYNERNMISVTDAISKTLGFQINNPNMNNMNSLTWLDLLTHVSTIADNLDMLKMVFTVGGSDSPVGNCEFVRNYLVSGGMYYSEANYYTSTELKQSKFKYSHMNYATLACALETMTNQTFDELAWSMLLSKVKPMAPKRTSYFYQDLANFRRSAANYYKPTNSTWARVVRTATPIYSAYGMQTTAADLANIGAWMLVNTPLNATTRAMMAMLTNDDTGEPGWNMTMGGYWTTTLSDGSRIYGYDSMGWFGNEWEPKEFSLSGGFWFSLTRNLVVSFLMNSFDYQDDQYNWVMSAFNANTYSSLTTTDAMSPNCQAHTTEVFCDQDPYCKWIVPWTIPAAGGLCVKAAANPVHILGPSAGVVPLNQYV